MASAEYEWWQQNWSSDLDKAIFDLNATRRKNENDPLLLSAGLCTVLEQLARAFFNYSQKHTGAETLLTPAARSFYPRRAANGNDENCKWTAPEIEDLVEALLGYPSTKLAAYGTLRPGESNHHIVADVDGIWRAGTMTGEVSQVRGYPSYIWNVSAASIPVQVLFSNSLQKEYGRIDQFEGECYERILVPVSIDGLVHVCYVYAGVSAKAEDTSARSTSVS